MQVPAIATHGFDPYGDVAAWSDVTCYYDTGWGLGSITRGISRAVKKAGRSVARVAKSVAKSKLIGDAVKYAQRGLANAGPIGMAAAGALGGLSAVVRGKNLEEIAWAAAEGAAPEGIRQAVGAAHALRRGEPVIGAALGATVGALSPEGKRAAESALTALKTGKGVAELARRRRSLRSEAERRAFDVAVGAVAKASRQVPKRARATVQRSAKRAASAAGRAAKAEAEARKRVKRERARQAMGRSSKRAASAAGRAAKAEAEARKRARTRTMQLRTRLSTAARRTAEARRRLHGLTRPGAVRDPMAEAAARRTRLTRSVVRLPVDKRLAQHPEWSSLAPQALARRLGVSQAEAVNALQRRTRTMRPRTLSPRALSFVARYSPALPIGLFRRDTRGFEQSGGEWIYIVESGDYPYKLAQQYAPGGKAKAGTTYRQLLKVNPQYSLNKKKDNFAKFYTGMRLKWPEGWTVPERAKPAPVPVEPETTPTPVVPSGNVTLATIIQAKALLATWGLSDGAGEAVVAGYGTSAADLTAEWTARDKQQLRAFSLWSNATRGTVLNSDGTLDPEHLDALKAWAEKRATEPVLPKPSAPAPVKMPPEVPALPAPTLPAAIKPPELPTSVITTTIPTPSATIPGAPKPPAAPPTPAPIPMAATAKPKKRGVDPAIPLLAGAAAFAFDLI
jgi:hypothetical protein